MYKLLCKLGFTLYCVTFTFTDNQYNYSGMVTTLILSRRIQNVKRKAFRKLSRCDISLNGQYFVDIEQLW